MSCKNTKEHNPRCGQTDDAQHVPEIVELAHGIGPVRGAYSHPVANSEYFDRLIQEVLEPMEQLREVQSQIDALVAAVRSHLIGMDECDADLGDLKEPFRRLQSLVVVLQARIADGCKLVGQVTNTLDRGITKIRPTQEREATEALPSATSDEPLR